jgi:hypothetical protein
LLFFSFYTITIRWSVSNHNRPYSSSWSVSTSLLDCSASALLWGVLELSSFCTKLNNKSCHSSLNNPLKAKIYPKTWAHLQCLLPFPPRPFLFSIEM